MGLYKQTADNRAWFELKAVRCAPAEAIARASDLSKIVPVAYIDNGGFDAIAILYSVEEAKRFVQGRPDALFGLVSRDDVPELTK